MLFLSLVCFSGCNSVQDKNSTLVNGGKWSTLYTDDSGFDIYKEYVFLNDEDFTFDERWFENFQDLDRGYHIRYTSLGSYQVSENRIQFNEVERQFWTDYSNTWQDTDTKSYEHSFEIFSSNRIKINGKEFRTGNNYE